MNDEFLSELILLAGFGQLLLAGGSIAIPRVLKWRDKLASLDPLTRRLFWVYAGYIFGTNILLGLVSIAGRQALLQPSLSSFAIHTYAAIYWTARLVIQFTVFRGVKPEGRFFGVAEFLLAALFLLLSTTYIVAVWMTAQGWLV